MRGERNTDHVTEYLLRAGRGFGGGTESVAVRELQVRDSTRDIFNQRDTHAIRSGLLNIVY